MSKINWSLAKTPSFHEAPIYFSHRFFCSRDGLNWERGTVHSLMYITYLGCILLGLFWLFLFRFRNNRIHGISISKRTLLLYMLQIWKQHRRWPENYYICARDRRGRPRRISRQKFPKRTRILSILSKPYSLHAVHSAIGSRMNGMIFRSFLKRNSSQKNTNTIYSEYSYSEIVPKERALRIKLLYPSMGSKHTQHKRQTLKHKLKKKPLTPKI